MSPIQRKWYVFIIVATGVFMSTMDSSMVNIALPTLMQTFHAPLKATQWVVLIYLLTITSSLLLWGSLADRIGRKRVYTSGLLLFASGSLACSSAPTLGFLIVTRFFQALGAAMMMSTGPALIKENFPPHQLGRGLGLIGVAVSLGLMTGPAIGGLLLQAFSWRALFFVTVPIGFFFSLLATKILPDPQEKPPRRPLSWLGGCAWIGIITTLSFTITYAATPTWSGSLLSLLCLMLFFVLLFFSILQHKSAHPFLPMHLIKQRFFFTALASASLSFMVLFAVLIITPFYLDLVRQLPKATIGFIMMSVPLAVLVVAPVAGWLAESVSARLLTTTGLGISTLALFLLGTLSSTSSLPGVISRLLLLGAGQALFLSPNSASVLHRVETTDSGKSAALLATARNLGMLVGIGQASLIFSIRFRQLTGGLDVKDYQPLYRDAFMEALATTFFCAAIIGCLGIFISFLRKPRRQATAEDM